MKKILLFVTIALFATSCKEYLDVKPHNRVVPTTAEEYSALIHTILNNIDYGHEIVILGNSSKMLAYDSYGQNIETTYSKAGLPKYIGRDINTLKGKYGDLYGEIKKFNIILNSVENTNEFNNDLIAVCHTLRAVCYYNLMIMYSEPFDPNNSDNQLGFSKVTQFDIEGRPKRDNLTESAEFIESELKTAISLECKNKEYEFTPDVAKAYLARLYFWTHNWGKAIDVAKDLVDRHPIIKGEEYKTMINSTNCLKGNEYIRAYTVSDRTSEQNFNQAMGNFKSVPISLELLKLLDDGDIRKPLYVNKDKRSIKPLVARIRSAEMCLIIAESYAYLNKPDEALKYLNMIRRNRFKNYVDYTSQTLPAVNKKYLIKEDAEGNALTALTYAIIKERHIELFAEGDRFFQLKMHGRPEFWVGDKDNIGRWSKYVHEKYLYTAPISKKDCEMINGLKQNPGYEN